MDGWMGEWQLELQTACQQTTYVAVVCTLHYSVV